MLAMKRYMLVEKTDRIRILDDVVFQILRDVLLRDTQGPPRAADEELEVLQAISQCSGAASETRAFAGQMWQQFTCPAARAFGSEAVLRQSIEVALKAWRKPKSGLLLSHDL